MMREVLVSRSNGIKECMIIDFRRFPQATQLAENNIQFFLHQLGVNQKLLVKIPSSSHQREISPQVNSEFGFTLAVNPISSTAPTAGSPRARTSEAFFDRTTAFNF